MGGWTDLEEMKWENVVWISSECSCKCDS